MADRVNVDYEFQIEKVQKMVLDSIKKYKTIGAFASEIGIDSSNFNAKFGVKHARWKNPCAATLVKLAAYYKKPIDFFFVHDGDSSAYSDEQVCEKCIEKERIIASKDETIAAQKAAISALRFQVDTLQKRVAEGMNDASALKKSI